MASTNKAVPPKRLKGWYFHRLSRILTIYGVGTVACGWILMQVKASGSWNPEWTTMTSAIYTLVSAVWFAIYLHFQRCDTDRIRVKLAYMRMLNGEDMEDVARTSGLSRRTVEGVYAGEYANIFLGLGNKVGEMEDEGL